MTGCIYVPVEDADRALADLGISVEAPNGVEERPWGAREILLTDPNGYNLALVEEP